MAAPVIAANNPLLNPNVPLSGSSLLQAATGIVNAQINPVLQDLAAQIAQNQRQTTGAENLTGGYFNQLGQQAQQGLTAEQGIQSDLNSQLAGLNANETSQLQGIGNDALASLQKYSPGSAGQTFASSLASEIGRQQGLAAQNQGAMSAFGAKQGANYSGLAASNLGTFGLKGQEDLSQIAQAGQIKNAPLTQKIADTQAQRGADLATAIGKLRQQEITNQDTAAGLGIKQQTANASTLNSQSSAKNAATNAQNANTNVTKANNSAKNQNFQNNPYAVGSAAWARTQAANKASWMNDPNAVGSAAWARANKASGGSGSSKGLLTAAGNSRMNDILNRAISAIDGLQDSPTPPTEQQIRTALANGSAKNNGVSIGKINPIVIEAAYELLGYGSIDQSTAAGLRSIGMYNTHWINPDGNTTQAVKVTPNFNKNNPAQNPPPPNLSGVLSTVGNAVNSAAGG